MIRVLVIDDDPDILLIAEGAILAEGHEAVTHTNPLRAVQLALDHKVDVIVLDITMPERDGFETLDELRANPLTGGLPVLFLSALGDSKHRVEGLRQGADDYLSKPFEPEELVLRLEKLAKQHQGLATSSEPEAVPDLAQLALDPSLFESFHLGRYEAKEVIGQGAMGIVFGGWDPRLKRQVALKTLTTVHHDGIGHRDAGHSDAARSEILSEAMTLARFSHPNIVAVYDVGQTAHVTYMVMELVEGISLQHLVNRRETLDAERLVALGIACARALDTAHQHQLVHRDLKPGNILVGRDSSIKITDFGVAGLVDILAQDQEAIFGTPGFVPPECLLGEAHKPVGDLYSLGAVLYRCATGHPAIEGRNLHDCLIKTMRGDIAEPTLLNGELPEALSQLILALLATRPEERPANAREVEDLLMASGVEVKPWRTEAADFEGAADTDPPRSALIDTATLRSIDDHMTSAGEESNI